MLFMQKIDAVISKAGMSGQKPPYEYRYLAAESPSNSMETDLLFIHNKLFFAFII